jgi:hypothetical protein
MVSEENIEFMKKRSAIYCRHTEINAQEVRTGTSCKRLEEVQPGLEVKICACPEGSRRPLSCVALKGGRIKKQLY